MLLALLLLRENVEVVLALVLLALVELVASVVVVVGIGASLAFVLASGKLALPALLVIVVQSSAAVLAYFVAFVGS